MTTKVGNSRLPSFPFTFLFSSLSLFLSIFTSSLPSLSSFTFSLSFFYSFPFCFSVPSPSVSTGSSMIVVREKLMFEFKVATDKMNTAILRGEEDCNDDDKEPPVTLVSSTAANTVAAAVEVEEEEAEAAAEEGGSSLVAAAAVRPWNLLRRSQDLLQRARICCVRIERARNAGKCGGVAMTGRAAVLGHCW